jgi:predicted HicB family RNase H-like nuclease
MRYCGRTVSGKILIRMPPALHEQLSARAAEQAVSLNQLVVSLLAGGIGFALDPKTAPAAR